MQPYFTGPKTLQYFLVKIAAAAAAPIWTIRNSPLCHWYIRFLRSSKFNSNALISWNARDNRKHTYEKKETILCHAAWIVAHRLQPTETRYTRTRNLLNGNIENRFRFAFSVSWIENDLIWHVQKGAVHWNRWRLWLRWPGLVPSNYSNNSPSKWYESMLAGVFQITISIWYDNAPMLSIWLQGPANGYQTKTNRCTRTVFESFPPLQSIEYIR